MSMIRRADVTRSTAARRWIDAAGASACLAGCAHLDPGHVLGFDDSDHPWHQVPGMVVTYVAAVPMFVVCLPIALIEPLLGGAPITSGTRTSVAKVVVAAPSMACGYVAAAPFFVLGLPFEFLAGDDEHAAAPPEPPPRK
jgi:hypothetical protein